MGPFGQTVAHGFLTLSLVAPLWYEVLEVSGVSAGINYGLDRVRFPSPVPSGAEIRLVATVQRVAVSSAYTEVAVEMVVESSGSTKPACVASTLFRYYREEDR